MALILKNGAIFLHIPKTGGNWVSKLLDELNLIDKRVAHKHADINHFLFSRPKRRRENLHHAINKFFHLRYRKSKPFMFCFVRNPLTWYESWFKYMSYKSRQWRNCGDELSIIDWHPNSMLNGLGSSDFNHFIRNVVTKRPGYVTEMYGWYTQSQIDFIGKQEHLLDDFIRVLQMMDLEFDEEYVKNYAKVNVSPNTDKKIVWQENLKKEVAMYEYAGMIRYGYESTLNDLGIDVLRHTNYSN